MPYTAINVRLRLLFWPDFSLLFLQLATNVHYQHLSDRKRMELPIVVTVYFTLYCPYSEVSRASFLRPFAACVTIQCRRHLVSLSRRVTRRKKASPPLPLAPSNNYEITRFNLRLRRFNFTGRGEEKRRLLCGVSFSGQKGTVFVRMRYQIFCVPIRPMNK